MRLHCLLEAADFRTPSVAVDRPGTGGGPGPSLRAGTAGADGCGALSIAVPK